MEASFRSLFGTVKILRSAPDASGRFARIYFQDGLVQNTVASDGRSLSFYTYALEALAFAYRPRIGSALVLGLGAGIVPMRLAGARRGGRSGRNRSGLARGRDPLSSASTRRACACTSPTRARSCRRCGRGYDVIVVDLFHGDGTPDYLITRDFFGDLRRCLGPGGIAVFNTFADLERPVAYAHLLTTLRAELPHIVLYRPDWPGAAHVNSFIVAGTRPLPEPQQILLDYVPPQHTAALDDDAGAAACARPRAAPGRGDRDRRAQPGAARHRGKPDRLPARGGAVAACGFLGQLSGKPSSPLMGED